MIFIVIGIIAFVFIAFLIIGGIIIFSLTRRKSPAKPNIQMVKRHSSSTCTETPGSGVGACPGPNGLGCYGLTDNDQSLWVDKGCRADFKVGDSSEFLCSSNEYKYNECPVP